MTTTICRSDGKAKKSLSDYDLPLLYRDRETQQASSVEATFEVRTLVINKPYHRHKCTTRILWIFILIGSYQKLCHQTVEIPSPPLAVCTLTIDLVPHNCPLRVPRNLPYEGHQCAKGPLLRIALKVFAEDVARQILLKVFP